MIFSGRSEEFPQFVLGIFRYAHGVYEPDADVIEPPLGDERQIVESWFSTRLIHAVIYRQFVMLMM